jgi:hypothetical protein
MINRPEEIKPSLPKKTRFRMKILITDKLIPRIIVWSNKIKKMLLVATSTIFREGFAFLTAGAILASGALALIRLRNASNWVDIGVAIVCCALILTFARINERIK